MKKRLTDKTRTVRVSRMVNMRGEIKQHLSDYHVKLMKGNSKTGESCWTVSLIPIADCPNCKGCQHDCYDVNNVCWRTDVARQRAINSAIHKYDPERFWAEVSAEVQRLYVEQLRLNVGGDLTDEDFYYVEALGKANPRTDILFFTKNYKGLNAFYASGHRFPFNIKDNMSPWKGMDFENPYNRPCAHVLYEDGTSDAYMPEFGAYYCGGNCTACHFKGEGCWTLKEGEHVVFLAH